MSGSNSFRSFVKLLHYRFREDDTNPKHLKSASHNTLHTSLTKQNELTDCCQEHIVENAANKENKYYFILASEASYCAMKY